MNNPDLDQLDIEISRLRGIPPEHLPAAYTEGTTPDGEDMWDGWYCPRCSCAEDDYAKRPCYRKWSRDWELAGQLLEEMQAAGLAVCVGYDTEDKQWYAAYNPFGSEAANDWLMFHGLTGPEAISRCRLVWKQQESK